MNSQCEEDYIQIIDIRSKMEGFKPKWRCFHEHSKNLAQSPRESMVPFRSNSKNSSSSKHNMEKSISSIGSLLSPKGPQRTIRQAEPIEYYQVNGKENLKKVDCYMKDPSLLKKQLVKIGQNRPHDRIVLDSAITLINNYEQKIKSLQQELEKLQKPTRKKSVLLHEGQINVKDGAQMWTKKSVGSEKTVESQKSSKTIADVKKNCSSNYYFPDLI